MFDHFRLSLFALCASAGLVLALDEPKVHPRQEKQAPKREALPEGREVEVRMTDGSTVRMSIVQDKLPIMTRYGKLNVATDDIIRIDFALHMPEGVPAKIDKAVEQLGSQEFKEREAASAELLKYGALAYQALQRSAKSTDAEVSRRSKDLLDRIRQKAPDEQALTRDFDVIKTKDFPINGKIEGTGIKARSVFFGEIEMKLADLRSMRSLARAKGIEVTVDAAKHGLAGGQQWLDTDLEIPADVELVVTASGQVNLNHPAGGAVGNQFMTGPGGHASINVGGPHRSGSLLGRIGEKGKVFLIGEKYSGTPQEAGKLYLQIVQSPWNNATGLYTVKINDAGTSTPADEKLPAEKGETVPRPGDKP